MGLGDNLEKIFEIKEWGQLPYELLQNHMEDFRSQEVKRPQLWFAEVHTVITTGLSTDLDDITRAPFPVQHTNRGGKATLHTYGQILMYPLVPVQQVRKWVNFLEELLIQTCADLGLSSFRIDEKPGVYTSRGKIASLGIRVSRGWSYHGLSFNIFPDLSLFSKIVSCGDKNIVMTSLQDHGLDIRMDKVTRLLIANFFALNPPLSLNSLTFERL